MASAPTTESAPARNPAADSFLTDRSGSTYYSAPKFVIDRRPIRSEATAEGYKLFQLGARGDGLGSAGYDRGYRTSSPVRIDEHHVL